MAQHLSVEKLRRFCIEALEKAGLCSDDAAIVAEVLVPIRTWWCMPTEVETWLKLHGVRVMPLTAGAGEGRRAQEAAPPHLRAMRSWISGRGPRWPYLKETFSC